MALCALNDDALGIISYGLCNPLEPRVAVAFSSASRGLRALTHALESGKAPESEIAGIGHRYVVDCRRYDNEQEPYEVYNSDASEDSSESEEESEREVGVGSRETALANS